MSRRMPIVGDTVILFPAINDHEARMNGAYKIPAIVTSGFESTVINLTAFPDQSIHPIPYDLVGHYNTMYKGRRVDLGYWCWPNEVELVEAMILVKDLMLRLDHQSNPGLVPDSL